MSSQPDASLPGPSSALAATIPSPLAGEDRPAPQAEGFTLPASCAYVTFGVNSGLRRLWQVDCGAAGRHDARGALAPSFEAQGWMPSGPALPTRTWIKGDVALTVSESSGEQSSYIRLTQSPRRIVRC